MSRRIKSLKAQFRRITIIPLILFGLITLIMTSSLIYTSLRDEVKHGLQHLSYTFLQICELSGNGDYRLEDNVLYRGDTPFDINNKIVDSIKHDSEVDATIFWGNKRISTTIKNSDGKRAIGTSASTVVQTSVLINGNEYFSEDVIVNDVPYFGNYIPLKNQDKKIVGMLFVGKSRESVMSTVYRSILVITSLLILMICIVSVFSLTFSQRIVESLNRIKDFLGRITKGDVDTPLDKSILSRNDEISEMGKFSVMLQKSVTELINTDALTGLFNRRSCTLFLESAIKDYEDQDIPFTVVIGDIDDFKYINDTYGHLAGDYVLKNIASIFKKYLGRNDIVARWGGEEFLFIFQRRTPEEVSMILQSLQMNIRHMKYSSDCDCEIIVTMTFGVSEYHDHTPIEDILKLADDKLYLGKVCGKDKVVLHDPNNE